MGLPIRRGRRHVVATALGLGLLLVAAACGGNETAGGGGTPSETGAASPSASATWSVSKDPGIAAQLPADVASKGTLNIAVDPSYAPNEFIPPGESQPVGMTIDLGNAIGDLLGLEVVWQPTTFDAIIPGLAAGKYDLGMSSFTDTKEREATVDFVTYFTAGTSFYVPAAGGPNVTGLNDSLCGLTAAVERGTTQSHDLEDQSGKCVSAGKPKITVNTYPDQNGANLAISSGRAQVGAADSPVAAYIVEQSNGQFKLSGQPYATAPYGIAIPRPAGTAPGQAPLTPAMHAAVQSLIDSGVYLKILTKWGVQQGAIQTSEINGAVY